MIIYLRPALVCKDNEGNLDGGSVDILADYGPLLVTSDETWGENLGLYAVTHRASTGRIPKSFVSFERACKAAEAWAKFPCWDWQTLGEAPMPVVETFVINSGYWKSTPEELKAAAKRLLKRNPKP